MENRVSLGTMVNNTLSIFQQQLQKNEGQINNVKVTIAETAQKIITQMSGNPKLTQTIYTIVAGALQKMNNEWNLPHIINQLKEVDDKNLILITCAYTALAYVKQQ